jgi:hypothetical protein
MPRSRRRGRGSPRPPSPTAQAVLPGGPTLAGRRIAPAREWRWRTFPVYFTFSATLFVATFLAQLSVTLTNLLWIVGALLFAGALSHLVTVLIIAPRMRRPRDR